MESTPKTSNAETRKDGSPNKHPLPLLENPENEALFQHPSTSEYRLHETIVELGHSSEIVDQSHKAVHQQNCSEPGDILESVNLCGAVTIKEVRLLLREWLESTPCPQEEDETVLVNYLNDLIVDKNLEQVDLVLKFLAR